MTRTVDDESRQRIAHRLRSARISRNLSQRDLAERLQISHDTLSNYELGKRVPPLSFLMQYADMLGVDVTYFFLEAESCYFYDEQREMFAAFIFFVLKRADVAPKYRGALVMSALVVGVAGYHYLRIFESWGAAFTFVDGMYVPSGSPFNDAYRHVDWLLTVPLLVAELVAVLALTKAKRASLTFRLAFAAALMVVLGYPGEIAADNSTRALWGFLSSVPFVYIVYVLFTEVSAAMKNEDGEVRVLLRNVRLLLLATWGFYPIVYMLPMLGDVTGETVVALQVGYAIADVLAKAGYGVVIYMIARAKSERDGWVEAQEGAVAQVVAGD